MEEIQHYQDGMNKVLTKLRHIGWILTFISLLTDVSHQRAFPSHNIIIGVSTCYCGTYTVLGEVHQSISGDSRYKARFSSYYKEFAQLKKMLSALILLTFFSLIFDVIFCITWGGDVSSFYSLGKTNCMVSIEMKKIYSHPSFFSNS